jgi:glutamine amidotransferase
VSRPTVAVLDYGSGNLRSVGRALARVGATVGVTSDVAEADRADAVVVPGVGAFAACLRGLAGIGGVRLIRDRVAGGRPVLGVCVGFQVLFGSGDEHGCRTEGVGVLAGTVGRLAAPVLPHMGWNLLRPAAGSRLFAGLAGERFYFVHSYAAKQAPSGPAGCAVTWAEYGEPFVAAVEVGPLAGTQFHPEKSGAAGLALLANWLRALP